MKVTIFSHLPIRVESGFPLNFLIDQENLEFERRYYYENPSKNALNLTESDIAVFISPGMSIPPSLLSGYHGKDKMSKTDILNASRFLYELKFISLAIKKRKKIIVLGDSIVLILMSYGMKFCQNVRTIEAITPAIAQIRREINQKTSFLERSFIADETAPNEFHIEMIRRPKFVTGHLQKNSRAQWKSKRYAYKEPIILYSKKINALFIKHVPISYHTKRKTILDHSFYHRLYELMQTFLTN